MRLRRLFSSRDAIERSLPPTPELPPVELPPIDPPATPLAPIDHGEKERLGQRHQQIQKQLDRLYMMAAVRTGRYDT